MTRYRIEPSALGKLEQGIARQMRATRIAKQLRGAGREITQYLRSRSTAVYYKGDYRTGWYGRVLRSTLTVGNKAPHFIFVEKGRRPNRRMPPVGIIREWVLTKGMKAGAAFPVARAIGKRGIKARPFFLRPTTQARMDRIVEQRLNRWLDKVIRVR
jgi:hypothetical protein